MRKKNVNRRTIEIHLTDFNFMDDLRTTKLGKVSFADVEKELVRVYKLYDIEHPLVVSE